MANPFEQTRMAESILSWLRHPRRKAGSADLGWLGTAVATSAGEVRAENQDRAVVAKFTHPDDRNQAFVAMLLCDGMGGMVEGGQCADIAVSEFLDYLVNRSSSSIEETLRGATLEANQAVHRTYRGRGGTTLTAVLFKAESVAAVSVGDSRLFEISDAKALSQISIDDTIAGELRRIHGADLPPSNFEPFSNRLAQFVGMGDELQPRTYSLHDHGGRYLICSDGVQAIPADTIGKVVSAAGSALVLANRLVNLSIWCGGDDNSSAICFGGDIRRTMFAEHKQQQTRLEIWDAFGPVEVLFVSLRPQARAVAAPSPIATNNQFARGTIQDVQPWKKSDPPKSKRAKRSESKNRKPKSRGDALGSRSPKQFQMEIVENSTPVTTNGSERPDPEDKE